MQIPIILASSSPARLDLLAQIKIFPNQVIPADIDETQLKNELPNKLPVRLASEKAIKIANSFDTAIIIAADTVCVSRRKVLPKAMNKDDIKYCMQQVSGRRHRVYTGICIIKKQGKLIEMRQRLVLTTVKFKKLTEAEILYYCHLEEGINKAGGYQISGYAESFVSFISGSYSNIKGLPLIETRNILSSFNVLPSYNKIL